mgnify:CR=1 FL=1
MALTGTEKTAYQKNYMAKRRQSGTRNVVTKDSARKRKNVLNRRRSFIVKEACTPVFHRVSKNRVRYGDAHVQLRPRTNDVRISTEVFSGCYKRTVIGVGAVSSDDVVWIDMGAHAGFFRSMQFKTVPPRYMHMKPLQPIVEPCAVTPVHGRCMCITRLLNRACAPNR